MIGLIHFILFVVDGICIKIHNQIIGYFADLNLYLTSIVFDVMQILVKLIMNS